MRDGSATKKRLEQCSMALFVEKGVVATTIKDIAQAADVAEGTLYRHYASKEDLATELYIKAYKDLHASVSERIAGVDNLKDVLKVIFQLSGASYDEDPITFNYLLIAQHHQLAIINQQDYSLNKFLCEIFDMGIKRGQITDRDPNYYSAVVMGLLIQAAVARTYHRIDKPLTDDIPDLYQACLRALEI